MKFILSTFLVIYYCSHVLGQEMTSDTISIMNYQTYAESIIISKYPKGDDQPVLRLSLGAFSSDLLNPSKSKIDRDSLISHFDDGFTVTYGKRQLANDVMFQSIRVFNNDDVQVRSITSLIGLTAVDIKGYLKYATRIELSEPFISINHQGTGVPLELSVYLF